MFFCCQCELEPYLYSQSLNSPGVTSLQSSHISSDNNYVYMTICVLLSNLLTVWNNKPQMGSIHIGYQNYALINQKGSI